MIATNTEKPILFSTELVQAILDGRKTQTRRVIKADEKGHVCRGGTCIELNEEHGLVWYPYGGSPMRKCPEDVIYDYSPYGQPGDELWVRETFALMKPHDHLPPSDYPEDLDIWYKADKEHHEPTAVMGKWRPSIHMPRWASRIQLKVEDIRVERVQEISEEDAKAEGVTLYDNHDGTKGGHAAPMSYKDSLSVLWDKINADRGYSWESNPWVWVVEFSIKNIKG